MATAVVSWNTKVQSFPSGTSATTYGVQLFKADGSAFSTTVTPSGNSASFGGVTAGDYIAKVRRYASGGAILSESQAAFTVAAPVAPPVDIEVPDVVVVNVS